MVVLKVVVGEGGAGHHSLNKREREKVEKVVEKEVKGKKKTG